MNPANLLRKIPALCRGDLATLYGVTIANSLLPLVTVPYLARVLGPGAWGMVLFAQTVAVWPAILMEFGFVYSATRDIARHADDPGKVREIVGEVMVCKFALSILGAASGVLFWLCVPEFRRQPIFLIGAMWIAIVQGFNPLWFFQGTQRMSRPAIIEVACRVIFTVSIFFLIRGPADAASVILYQAASATLSLALGLHIMYRSVKFTLSSVARAARTLRDSWHFFLFVAINALYSRANGFLLGILGAPGIVSYYGGPERVLGGLLSLTSPINQVLYPRLAHLVKHDLAEARKTVRRGTFWLVAISILVGLSMIFGATWIVRVLFGPGYDRAVPVMRVMGFACPFIVLKGIMGIRWMFPLGHERIYNRIVMIAALLDVALMFALTPWLREFGAALAILITEMSIMIAVFVVLWKMRLNPFQNFAIKKSATS